MGSEQGPGTKCIRVVKITCDAGVRSLLRSMKMEDREKWLGKAYVKQGYPIRDDHDLEIDTFQERFWESHLMDNDSEDPGLAVDEKYSTLNVIDLYGYFEKLRELAKRCWTEKKY